MLLQTAVLLSGLILAAGYSCPNRLYRGQRLNVSQFLCSRNQNYRLLFNNTGPVQINEAFLSNTSFKPIPLTLFSTNTTSPSPSHVTFTDAGDFVAVGTDGTVYWQANVSGADFLELQDTGIAVLFAKNASTVRVLWKSLSTYSLRIVNGTNQTVGRLEFYFNNTWGSVSTYSADNNLYARVACRTLGFDTGVVVANTFGQLTGPVWMDDMSCNGRETVFQECPFGNWSSKNWWGQVSSTSHTNDAAISCQGNSSLGVLAPAAHVCTDRLYVGQTLALGDSLCAGPNGEYTLRFTNKRTDTVIELWYKSERKWSIGMTNAMPAGAAVCLDADGVMRIVNATASLYNLFSNTTANASFVELQDNGVVRVASANGSTGWRKAPDDICYTEKRKIRSYDIDKYITSSNLSPLACLASCDSQPTCKTIAFRESDGDCNLLSGYPWDTSTTSSTYLEKIVGCPSGAGCYQSYSYDRWDNEPYISSSASTASASACRSLCDSTATCVSAYYTPSTTTCYVGWKRLSETVDNSYYTSYYKTPCVGQTSSQWIANARDFSSQYTTNTFAAFQITGPPNVYPAYGTNSLSWAPLTAGSSSEFLEFDINNPVYVKSIELFETWQCGFVTQILSLNSSGQWEQLYTGPNTRITISRIFSPTLQQKNYLTKVFRLNMNCSLGASWCELDAVRINGTVNASDPSQVPLLPVKACPTQLLPGAFLLSQQYLCSPNGQHVLTVEKDGRLLIDGGKWISNNATNRSGYLQYTTTNQLLLRLDDGSTPWKVDAPSSTINPPAGYVGLSDGGILKMFDSTGQVIWDHQNGSHLIPAPIISTSTPTLIVDVRFPDVTPLVDSDATSCVRRVEVAKFRLSNATLNTTWDVVMTGHDLQCGNGRQEGTHSFSVAYETVWRSSDTNKYSDLYKMSACSLLTEAPLACRYRCVCPSSYCEMFSLRYHGCSDPQGDICELTIE